jgi:hypothetical protein
MPADTTEQTSIDWDAMSQPETNVNIALKDTELGTTHEVTFVAVRQLPEGVLVADVTSPTLEGNTLWLRGKFGPQSGLMSLIKAADGGENIEGNTFNFTRVESEKSPAGYAFRWTA